MLSPWYYLQARKRYQVYSEIVESLGEDPDARMCANRDLAKIEMIYYGKNCIKWCVGFVMLFFVIAIYYYLKG